MSITSSGSNPSENIIRNLFIQQGMPSPKYMVVTGRLGEYNEQTRQVMLYVGDAEVEIPLTVDEKTPITFRKVTSPDEDPFSLWDLGPGDVPSMAALAASDDIATKVDNNIFFRDCIESVTRREAYTNYRPLALAEGTVYLHTDGTQTFQLNRMTVASHLPGLYRWEEHSYWGQHLNQLMESRLAFLFDDTSVIGVEDIGKHWRTNINSLGESKGDIIETATLARFTYGAASVALVNDNKQARDAAKAAAEFQIRELADNTGDSNIRLWLHGKSRDENGRVILIKPASGNADRAHIPLYEQIYDIAGLTQTFLVTRNKTLLVNVVRTMNAFERFFKVEGRQGWWSHIDVTTHQPCEERLGINKGGINWNSVGDHVPAYLFSLLAALGPKYNKSNADADLNELRDRADDMLKEAVEIIVREFPGEDHPTVRERFNLDEDGNFVYNDRYDWQQNRAIVGHNFKIVWNLTRAANYFNAQGDRAERAGHSELADDYRERAQSAAQLAERLNDDMMRLGIDPVSFLLHDGVERQPTIPGELQVPWGPHGDFWQHEQVVHALGEQYGWHMRLGNVQKAEKILEYWRKLNLVWTEKFLDRVNRSVHFRINDQFSPIAQSYNHIGGIDIAGYHESEYALLQNFMTKMYLTKKPFSLTFDLDAHRVIEGTVDEYVSVAGDAWVLGLARIIRVAVNGTPFEIPIEGNELVPNPEEPIINLQQMGLDGANNLKATKLTVWFQPKSWEEYWQEHNITPVSTQVPHCVTPSMPAHQINQGLILDPEGRPQNIVYWEGVERFLEDKELDAELQKQQPLAGTKVVIVVGDGYIADEFKAYAERFQAYGADVRFATRMWGQLEQPFDSDSVNNTQVIERLVVKTSIQNFADFSNQKVSIVVAPASNAMRKATYATDATNPGDNEVTQFFQSALANPNVVVAANCHGLYAFTPAVKALDGYQVAANGDMSGEVRAAGAVVLSDNLVDELGKVVIDRNLVTTKSGKDTNYIIDAATRTYMQIAAS